MFKNTEHFLQATNEISSCPTSLVGLADQVGTDFEISPSDNSKGIFIPWRVGAYVTKDTDAVKNTLLLLDGYFQKDIKSSTGEPVFVELYPSQRLGVC